MVADETDARPRSPTPNEPREPRRQRTTPRWLPAVLLGVLLVGGIVPLASAGPALGASTAPAARPAVDGIAIAASASGPTATWAWGAAANISIGASFVGAYNSSQSLTGGNLTNSGAYIAVAETGDIAYAVYAIVNVSTPSTALRYVTVQAAEYRAESFSLRAAGTFPVAGTYAANVTPPLTPMNVSLVASVQTLTAYRADLNFTSGPNGSLSLQSEHVVSLRAINISLAAVNFPNVTRFAAGGEQVSYSTGAVSAAGYVAESMTASFAPALPVVVGPLSVGKSWTASSNVTFQGWAAYAEAIRATSAGTSVSGTKSGGVSLNMSVPLSLTFTVTGTKTVYLPDGSTEVDYVIAYQDASGSGGILLANGLIVLPARDPTKSAGLIAAVPERPATTPLAATVVPGGSALYSTQHQMVDGQEATPSGSTVVTAAPETPAQARASIRDLGQPMPPPAAAAPRSGFPGALLMVWVAGAGVAVAGLSWVARKEGARRP